MDESRKAQLKAKIKAMMANLKMDEPAKDSPYTADKAKAKQVPATFGGKKAK
jgi:hypothetical protein